MKTEAGKGSHEHEYLLVKGSSGSLFPLVFAYTIEMCRCGKVRHTLTNPINHTQEDKKHG